MLFEEFSPFEIATLAQITALILADNLDADDLGVLGQFITTVGDLIALLSEQKDYLANNSNKNVT